MVGVVHIDEGRKKLAKEVHCLTWLSMTLCDTNEGDIHVHNGSKSSIVMDVQRKARLGSDID